LHCAALTLFVGLALADLARAEDLKGRWYFGGNLSFLSTTDDIRSNSNIIIGPPGDDGIPFTGDPNEAQGCPADLGQQTSGLFCDPRPDDQLSRASSIEETFMLGLTAGFGLTSWLSLQLDAGYFKGNVGPVDAFVRDAIPVGQDTGVGFNFIEWKDQERVVPVTAGEITEIPVSLTGIVRFRKDSPLNPYVGIGVGMIFSKIDRSEDVDQLNLRLSRLRIKGVQDEFGKSLTTQADAQFAAFGGIPFRNPVTVEVEDAFEWHAVGGAEYFFNDRISMVFDARYTFADASVHIDLNGINQVDYTIFSEDLFRPDGTVRLFNSRGQAPNPIKPGTEDPNIPGSGSRFTCDASKPGPRDIDDDNGNGNPFDDDDFCYNPQVLTESRKGSGTPTGIFVVQGGKIDLTGFSVAVGVRFHF